MLLENAETNALVAVQDALKAHKVKSKITYGQKTGQYYLTFTEFGRTFVIDYWIGNKCFNVREWVQDGFIHGARKSIKNMVHRDVFKVHRNDFPGIETAALHLVSQFKG